MTKHEPVRLTVRYLGVVRLMSGRKEDILEFQQAVTVGQVLERLRETLPKQAFFEISRQTLVLSPLPSVPGTVLSMPRDTGKMVENGNCLTVVTPVTGG